MLVTSQEFQNELKALIRTEMPDSDPATTEYLARLFSTGKTPTWDDIKNMWSGSWKEIPSQEDRLRVFGEKLDFSKRAGDGCLVFCAFYREPKRPQRHPTKSRSPEILSTEHVPIIDRRSNADEYEPVPLDKPRRVPVQVTPALELTGLGKASYNRAGFYSAMLDGKETGVYPALSRDFLRIAAKVGPAILRNYLGEIDPPKRAVFYTPNGGEVIVGLRISVN